MAVPITPRNMVVRALTRRKISNTPTVLPAAPSSQPSPNQLYNFSDVGGLAGSQQPEAKAAVTGDTYNSSGTGIPPVATMGGLDLPGMNAPQPPQPGPPQAGTRPRIVPNQPVTGDLGPDTSVDSDSETLSPAEARLRDLMAQRTILENTPVEDDDNKLTNFYHGAQYAVRQVQRQGGDLGATVGALIGGGLRNLFNPTEDDKRKLDEDKAFNAKHISDAEKEVDDERNRSLKAAQTATIPIDDKNKELELKDKQDARQERVRNQAAATIYKRGTFDPTNPIDQRLATTAGIDPATMTGYDDRSPITKLVAGVTYKYNRQTGNFEEAGLPADGSKANTEYKVQMPSGEVRTYTVSNEKAAAFSTQMSALGAKLSQQDKEFKAKMGLETAKFEQAKKQYADTMDLRQKTFNALQDARNNNDANQQKRLEQQLKDYDLRVQNLRIAADKAHKNQELDDDQYSDIMSLFPKQ